MGSKQEHRGWLQVQGWDLTGLRDMCSGLAHLTAMLQLRGIWAFRNGKLEGKDRELAFMHESSRNAWTLPGDGG